jgi:hypothetical protein
MSSSKKIKKLTCKWTLRQCSSVGGPEPYPPPPPHTHCIRVYCIFYLFTQGSGGRGRVEPERRLDGQQFTKLGRKYQHDWLYLHLQPINSNKHRPAAKFLYRWIILDDDILLWCLYSYLVHGWKEWQSASSDPESLSSQKRMTLIWAFFPSWHRYCNYCIVLPSLCVFHATKLT